MSRNVFSVFESELLYELIKKRIDVIECKKTNSITNAKKIEAFEDIAREFNACENVKPRTAKQLRQRYQNCKKIANKNAATIRREVRKTGGGTIDGKSLSEMDDKILSLNVVTQPLQTTFDSDCSHLDYITSQELLSNDESNSVDMSQNSQNNQIPEETPVSITAVQGSSTPVFITAVQGSSTPVSITAGQGSSTPVSQVRENTSNPPPCKRPRALELFRKKTAPKTVPVKTSSSRTAEAIIDESKTRKELEKKRFEREEEEHKLKLELLYKKFDLEAELMEKELELKQKELELKQKKIEVQNKILDILESSPEKISLNIK